MSLKEVIRVNAHYTRSINLERDADSLAVVNAYIPVSSALRLFARVAEGFGDAQAPRAWSLIGPYGSGKSSCSVFLSHLLSAPELATTKAGFMNLKSSAPSLAKVFQQETAKSNGYLKVLVTGSPEPMGQKIIAGLVVSIESFFSRFPGKKPGVVGRLKELATRKDVSTSELLTHVMELQAVLANRQCKGIYLVIDELGNFLEFEARRYNASDIYLLQALAEHACKGGECNLLLFVLLHQTFEQYAKGHGENLKHNWSKVQGRFEDVPFLESSEQVLRVVGAAFDHEFSAKESRQIKSSTGGLVAVLQQSEALPGGMDQSSALDIMLRCHPLHPLSALLLPVLCQKVAQNERTLFSYLGSHEESGLQDMLDRLELVDDYIYPHHVYDYFIANQPAALGDYGTHRRWVEVATAIERLGDAPAEQVNLLKTIGLLNIIGAKGGLKASKAVLETCGRNSSDVSHSLQALSDKSIITHRRFSGEYRVWQGSDFDLDEALAEAVNNLGQFSLATALNEMGSAMPIVARRYTIKSGTLRYFQPIFVDAHTYAHSELVTQIPRIVFFLASAQDDEKIFHDAVVKHYSDIDIVALCLGDTQLREATAEVLALRYVQNTRQELNGDPVAKREFADRLAAAERYWNLLLQRLQEQPQEYMWFHQGTKLEVSSKRNFQRALSEVLKRVYCKSPALHNELINRDKPSPQANAARKKLLDAMLDCPDKLDLGIQKFPPEKAIYRSLILGTGLHTISKTQTSPSKGNFRAPDKDSPLFAVWQRIDVFLDTTEKHPRSFAELNKVLLSPPYGVKAGVLPILYIAVYLVYQHELALYEERRYRPVLTREMVHRFVKRPDEFTFQRFRIAGLRSSIYKEYRKIIDTGSRQTVVQLVSPLAKFIGELPDYTRKTRSTELSMNARAVRDAFQLAKSPVHLIFEDIPKALGFEKELESRNPKLEGLSLALQGCLKELKDAYPNMIRQQQKMLAEAFYMNDDSTLADLRRQAAGRYVGLEQHTLDVDGLRAFIKRITKQGGSDEQWLENVLMFLGQKPPQKWTDADRAEADVKLSDFAKRMIDLEALRIHYDKARYSMDGDFEVILLKSLRKGSEPVDAVVAIDGKRQKAIADCKCDLIQALQKHSDNELQLAALAEVVDNFLAERNGTEKRPSNADSRNSNKGESVGVKGEAENEKKKDMLKKKELKIA